MASILQDRDKAALEQNKFMRSVTDAELADRIRSFVKNNSFVLGAEGKKKLDAAIQSNASAESLVNIATDLGAVEMLGGNRLAITQAAYMGAFSRNLSVGISDEGGLPRTASLTERTRSGGLFSSASTHAQAANLFNDAINEKAFNADGQINSEFTRGFNAAEQAKIIDFGMAQGAYGGQPIGSVLADGTVVASKRGIAAAQNRTGALNRLFESTGRVFGTTGDLAATQEAIQGMNFSGGLKMNAADADASMRSLEYAANATGTEVGVFANQQAHVTEQLMGAGYRGEGASKMAQQAVIFGAVASVNSSHTAEELQQGKVQLDLMADGGMPAKLMASLLKSQEQGALGPEASKLLDAAIRTGNPSLLAQAGQMDEREGNSNYAARVAGAEQAKNSSAYNLGKGATKLMQAGRNSLIRQQGEKQFTDLLRVTTGLDEMQLKMLSDLNSAVGEDSEKFSQGLDAAGIKGPLRNKIINTRDSNYAATVGTLGPAAAEAQRAGSSDDTRDEVVQKTEQAEKDSATDLTKPTVSTATVDAATAKAQGGMAPASEKAQTQEATVGSGTRVKADTMESHMESKTPTAAESASGVRGSGNVAPAIVKVHIVDLDKTVAEKLREQLQ